MGPNLPDCVWENDSLHGLCPKWWKEQHQQGVCMVLTVCLPAMKALNTIHLMVLRLILVGRSNSPHFTIKRLERKRTIVSNFKYGKGLCASFWASDCSFISSNFRKLGHLNVISLAHKKWAYVSTHLISVNVIVLNFDFCNSTFSLCLICYPSLPPCFLFTYSN